MFFKIKCWLSGNIAHIKHRQVCEGTVTAPKSHHEFCHWKLRKTGPIKAFQTGEFKCEIIPSISSLTKKKKTKKTSLHLKKKPVWGDFFYCFMTGLFNRAEPKNPHVSFLVCILVYSQISWQITQDTSAAVLWIQKIHDSLLILQGGTLGAAP